MSDESCVYFLEDPATGLVKIGYSEDPARRQRQLEITLKRSLNLLALAPGDRELERILHKAFSADRVHGEWFTRTAAMEVFIPFVGRSRPLRPSVISDIDANGFTHDGAAYWGEWSDLLAALSPATTGAAVGVGG